MNTHTGKPTNEKTNEEVSVSESSLNREAEKQDTASVYSFSEVEEDAFLFAKNHEFWGFRITNPETLKRNFHKDTPFWKQYWASKGKKSPDLKLRKGEKPKATEKPKPVEKPIEKKPRGTCPLCIKSDGMFRLYSEKMPSLKIPYACPHDKEKLEEHLEKYSLLLQ